MKKILLPVAVLVAVVACQKEQEPVINRYCGTGLTYDATKQVHRWVERSARKDTISFGYGPAGENVLVVKNDTVSMLQIFTHDQRSIGLKPHGSLIQGFTTYDFRYDTEKVLLHSDNFIDPKRLPKKLVFEPAQ